MFLFVIPVNFLSIVVLTLNFHGYFVKKVKILQEMINTGIVNVFDTKIINTKKKSLLHATRGIFSISKGHNHEEQCF